MGGELTLEYLEEPVDPARLRCFVIGPIGNRHDPDGSEGRIAYEEALAVWEEVIEPACRRVGLVPVRADGLTRAGEITDQIFRRLRDDDVVIADLTGANANVMYELGLRHTRPGLTVQVGEYGRLPFDISVIRTVMFSRSPMGLVNARNELAELLDTGLAGQYDPVSATRIWAESGAVDVSAGGQQLGQETSVEPIDDDAPGFLDLVVAGEDELDNMVAALGSIGEDISDLAELAVNSTAEMSASDAKGAGAKGRLVVAAKYANGLDGIADRLVKDVDKYAHSLGAVSSGQLALIERLEEDPDQVAEGMEYGMTIRGMATRAREGFQAIGEMVTSMQESARTTRVIRPATRRITDAVDRLLVANEVMDEWDRRLQALGIPIPPPDEDEAIASDDNDGFLGES